MNIDELFVSKYLKADDLKGRDVTLTIASVELQEMKDERAKPCIFFVGKDKGMLLNKTNSYSLADMFGNETDSWIGKQITLFTQRVMFEGKMTPAIRIRNMPPQQQAPARNSATKADWDTQKMAGPPSGHPASEAPFNDDPPF